MREMQLTNMADATNVTFDGADLSNAIITDSHYIRASFRNAKFDGVRHSSISITTHPDSSSSSNKEKFSQNRVHFRRAQRTCTCLTPTFAAPPSTRRT